MASQARCLHWCGRSGILRAVEMNYKIFDFKIFYMTSIGKNEKLFEYFTQTATFIISSTILEVDLIKEGFYQVVEVTLELISSEIKLKLRFTGVNSYKFTYEEFYPYYVETCKFFFNNDYVYMSLSPVSEDEVIDINDNQWVLAKDVEGFILPN